MDIKCDIVLTEDVEREVSQRDSAKPGLRRKARAVSRSARDAGSKQWPLPKPGERRFVFVLRKVSLATSRNALNRVAPPRPRARESACPAFDERGRPEGARLDQVDRCLRPEL